MLRTNFSFTWATGTNTEKEESVRSVGSASLMRHGTAVNQKQEAEAQTETETGTQGTHLLFTSTWEL